MIQTAILLIFLCQVAQGTRGHAEALSGWPSLAPGHQPSSWGESSSTSWGPWQGLRELWDTGFCLDFGFFCLLGWCFFIIIFLLTEASTKVGGHLYTQRWGRRLEPSNYEQRLLNFTFEPGLAVKVRNICLHRLLLLAIVLTVMNSAWAKDDAVFFCISAEDVGKQRQQELRETGELEEKHDDLWAVWSIKTLN